MKRKHLTKFNPQDKNARNYKQNFNVIKITHLQLTAFGDKKLKAFLS